MVLVIAGALKRRLTCEEVDMKGGRWGSTFFWQSPGKKGFPAVVFGGLGAGANPRPWGLSECSEAATLFPGPVERSLRVLAFNPGTTDACSAHAAQHDCHGVSTTHTAIKSMGSSDMGTKGNCLGKYQFYKAGYHSW